MIKIFDRALAYLFEIKNNLHIIYSQAYNFFNDASVKIKNIRGANIDLALYHFENGNFSDAVFRLNFIKFIWGFQDNHDLYYYLGRSYFKIHKYIKSEECINLYLKNKDSNVLFSDECNFCIKIIKNDLNNITSIPETIIYNLVSNLPSIYFKKYKKTFIPNVFIVSNISLTDIISNKILEILDLEYKSIEKNILEESLNTEKKKNKSKKKLIKLTNSISKTINEVESKKIYNMLEFSYGNFLSESVFKSHNIQSIDLLKQKNITQIFKKKHQYDALIISNICFFSIDETKKIIETIFSKNIINKNVFFVINLNPGIENFKLKSGYESFEISKEGILTLLNESLPELEENFSITCYSFNEIRYEEKDNSRLCIIHLKNE